MAIMMSGVSSAVGKPAVTYVTRADYTHVSLLCLYLLVPDHTLPSFLHCANVFLMPSMLLNTESKGWSV